MLTLSSTDCCSDPRDSCVLIYDVGLTGNADLRFRRPVRIHSARKRMIASRSLGTAPWNQRGPKLIFWRYCVRVARFMRGRACAFGRIGKGYQSERRSEGLVWGMKIPHWMICSSTAPDFPRSHIVYRVHSIVLELQYPCLVQGTLHNKL